MLRIELGTNNWEDSCCYTLHTPSQEAMFKGEFTIVEVEGPVPFGGSDADNIVELLNGYNAQNEAETYYHFKWSPISEQDAAKEVALVNTISEARKALKSLRACF